MTPARRQRGVIKDIDFYEHTKFKVRVPISLNKETGKFSAEYNEETFYTDTLEALKHTLYEYIQATVGLEWIPIMEVMVSGEAHTITDVINDEMHGGETYQRKFMRVSGSLGIEAKRYYIAQRPDGKWMKCEVWDSIDYLAEGREIDHEFLAACDRRVNAHDFYEANHRLKAEFKIPCTKSGVGLVEGDTYYLPYDEGIWTALNAIGDKMRELLAQLIAMVGTEPGRARLAGFAQRMLPAAREESVKA